jgi:LAO/AO transport system kinase
LDRTLEGDRVAAARLITLIENQELPLDILHKLHAHTGRARIIGITGSPGAGKSTLVDRLADHYRKAGLEVGVIAVDPSSPFSGGAVLGDRIRMQSRSTDPGVFVRSMGSRGALGGLAAATNDAAKVLDALGKDVILVETVGVGQGEVDIIRSADTIVVVLVPGMGDDVQTIKAGIMEIGDIFCVNKADRPGTGRTVGEIAAFLEMADRGPKDWIPKIVQTVASKDEGTKELVEAMDAHRKHLESSGELKQRRRRRAEAELIEVLKSRVVRYVLTQERLEGRFDAWLEDIVARRKDPHEVALEILNSATIDKLR